MSHLTTESWARLRAGEGTPGERAALLAHLTEPCDACDDVAFDDLGLDAAADHALARLGTPAEPPSLALRRIEARVLASVSRPARARRAAFVASLAAAAAVVWGVVSLPAGVGQREKGDAAVPPRLTALVTLEKGGRLEPVGARAYPSSAELFFTYVLPRDGHVYLARVGVDGVVEPFYPALGQPDAVERAGSHPLTVGGTVHAYALEGLRGRQRFVVVTAPEPLSPADVAAAVKSGGAPGAEVELEVEGW